MKTEMAVGDAPEKKSSPAMTNAAASSVPARKDDSPDVKRLSAPVRLVYSCTGDNEFYHASTHLPSRCQRSALSEEAALRRGLKPCRKCMPE